MSLPFNVFFQRLCTATDIRNQMDLARALGLNRSAITQAKTRDSVPQKWILALARKYTVSPDWLEFGTGEARPPARPEYFSGPAKTRDTRSGQERPAAGAAGRSTGLAPDPEKEQALEDVIYIPKTAARLCAGGGSFEVDAEPVALYPLPRNWLYSLGKPASMIFMDVVGDSMEPGICDGDMVLVDRSNTQLYPTSIMAVGFEDAIYLKRVLKDGAGLVMHSDNPAYGPVALRGDELNTFRVIGKMVWMCRRYR